ncbi:mannitol-1-phosphate 5-dehydrogenase [Planomicrobium soli]|uniref:Mannitol-1-phosphate 5-dehydrogenase n=1 Tax=Planomicrobium soli TaxID=1176648 RepID=A0A2P8H6E4_9BACL|nr:mannitol-1-phosphate 5-dehydrogenase [Planomicrobium soli]PSL41807.1 mannitol-1-phosphate 5-dehydrogenase [Planomicrobium soli]
MQAVHFGAGNIGRGFIGALLHQSGYQTLFLDVNDTVIQELNQKREYEVTLVGTEQEIISVKNVSGLNSSSHPDEAIEAISKADLVTAAVGPNVLAHIAELIAEGLKVRMRVSKEPLNVIACENMINGSSILKKHVFEYLNEEERQAAEQSIGFPNAAVDRIVPDQRPGNILGVAVEPYYEWVVEQTSIKGERPEVKGITYVDDLNPYIERKLFTVNTGHAVPAYLGHYKKYSTINEAMGDEEIKKVLYGALSETGEVVVRQHKFDQSEHGEYIRKIIERFSNPYISDYVTRVARGPIRKLGQNDRLIRPASLYIQLTGKEPVNLATVIAGVLLYDNEQDDEARRLQDQIAEKGYEATLQSVSGLAAGDPLIAAVMKHVNVMKR